MFPHLCPRLVLLLTLGTNFVLPKDTFTQFWSWAVPQLDDVIFDTLGLAEFPVPSLSRCLLSCTQDARCVSVFYQESRGQCRLQGGRFYLAQGGRAEQGWRYYLMDMDNQCPVGSGYIHRRDLSLCYRLEFQMGATHSEAFSSCIGEGGHLLRIYSQEKQDHVEQQLGSSNATGVDFFRDVNGSPGYYIDGEYIEGAWIWLSSGQQMTFGHWNSDENKLSNPTQTVVIVGYNQEWRWRSVDAYHSRPYICEITI